jgi:ribosomal biogenesis protein LAS1
MLIPNSQSLFWLLHNYFLPTLNPSTVSQAQVTQLRPLAPILKQYKSLLKITTRDASVVGQYKAAISAVQRDTERWVLEAKVAAEVAVGELGWESGPASENLGGVDEDLKERWALDRFCDGLLQKGLLVPLSKK